MPYIMTGVGVVLSLLVMAVSATMNARYGMSLARDGFDQYVMMAAAVFADLGKTVAWIFFVAAFARRQWLATVTTGLMFVACMLFALQGSLGFIAMNRAQSTANVVSKGESAKDLSDELRRKQLQLESYGILEPEAVIGKLIEAKKQSVHWSASQHCTDARSNAARSFCAEVAKLEADKSKARAIVALENEITVLRTRRDAAGGVATPDKGDFQAVLIAQLTRMTVTDVQLSLSLVLVIMIELGACFFLGATVTYWQSARKDASDRRRAGEARILVPVAPEPVTTVSPDVSTMAAPAPVSEVATPSNVVVLVPDEKRGTHGSSGEGSEVLAAPVGDFVAFVETALELVDHTLTAQDEIERAYVTWCRRGGCLPVSEMLLRQDIEKFCKALEVERGRRDGVVYLVGVELKKTRRRRST